MESDDEQQHHQADHEEEEEEGGNGDEVEEEVEEGEQTKERRRGICHRFYKTGVCKFGDACKFLHERKRSPAPKSEIEDDVVTQNENEEDSGDNNNQEESSSGKRRGLCFRFARTGECKFGDECKFLHKRDLSSDAKDRSEPQENGGETENFAQNTTTKKKETKSKSKKNQAEENGHDTNGHAPEPSAASSALSLRAFQVEESKLCLTKELEKNGYTDIEEIHNPRFYDASSGKVVVHWDAVIFCSHSEHPNQLVLMRFVDSNVTTADVDALVNAVEQTKAAIQATPTSGSSLAINLQGQRELNQKLRRGKLQLRGVLAGHSPGKAAASQLLAKGHYLINFSRSMNVNVRGVGDSESRPAVQDGSSNDRSEEDGEGEKTSNKKKRKQRKRNRNNSSTSNNGLVEEPTTGDAPDNEAAEDGMMQEE